MPPEKPTARAVVFDLDDTLYAERDYVRSGYRAVAEHLRRRLGRPEAFDDWLWQRFCAGTSAGALDALNAAFALGLDAGQIAELVAVYRGHTPTLRPRDGAIELLEQLGESYRLALLSDGFLPAQRLKLDALGLGRFFEAIVFTEEMGRDCWKPSPAGYEAARQRLGVPHEACAYVGDNPAKDFLAANRLGWQTIRLLCDGQVHAGEPAPAGGEPHVVIRRLDELPDALR